jgi:hypothetical protein
METLGTFILNKNKFLTFSYKKKKITMWDITRKSDPVAPSSKDLKDISKEILQGNQRSTQKMKKEFDRVVADKDKEIYRLKIIVKA